MQDPNPLPWGAQDKFQIHFIVKKKYLINWITWQRQN